MIICKGRKSDGTPCSSRVVMENGYCHEHQEQAYGRYHWTKERLEAAIKANGGPEGLDLAGHDLSNVDMSGMDLHGIVLSRQPRLQLTPTVARLKGVRLDRTDLRAAKLQEVVLSGVAMRGAKLQKAKLAGADLRDANLIGAHLEGAFMSGAKLQGARLAYSHLQRADLCSAELQRALLHRACLREADLRGSNLRELDLSVVAEDGLHGARLWRAKLEQTLLFKEQLSPAIGDELLGEYVEARRAYLSLKQNFESLGDYEAASWAYIKERRMKKKCSAPRLARRFYGKEELGDSPGRRLPGCNLRVCWFYLRHTAKWGKDWVTELVCNYGEGLCRTVAAMVVMFWLFIGVYWWCGAVMRVEHEPGLTRYTPVRNWKDLAVFSLSAMTTIDTGDLVPRASWVRFLMGIEALLGIGLTGLLGFVLGNKIRRS